MAYNVEHLFICLFVICMSSLMRDLLRFWSIKKFFLLLSIKDSSSILNDSPVSVVSFTKYFPLIYGLSFHSLAFVFFFFFLAAQLMVFYFPYQGLNLGPQL